MFLFILLSILAGFFVCLCVYFAIMACCVFKNREGADGDNQQQGGLHYVVPHSAEAKMDSAQGQQEPSERCGQHQHLQHAGTAPRLAYCTEHRRITFRVGSCATENA